MASPRNERPSHHSSAHDSSPPDSIAPGSVVTIHSALKPWPADMDPETTPLIVFPELVRDSSDEEPTL